VIGVLKDPVTRRAKVTASAVLAAITIVTCLVLPVSAMALAVLKPFLTMYSTAVFLIESLTAYFLAIQFRASRDPFLAALAGAYGFTAVLVLFQLLVFPGIFSTSGLFGAGPQTAIWIWVFWHAGSPVFVTLALLLRSPRLAASKDHLLPRIATGLMFSAPIIAVLAAFVAIAWSRLLPPLISGNSYYALQHSPVALVVLALAIVPVLVCLLITRLGDLLALWLCVSLAAGISDVLLAISASARFSLGWYAGRGISLMSSCIVLCVLILEFSRLYDQLIKSNSSLRQRAIYDGLTGAFNRGYFNEQSPRERRRAIREREPLSLLMVDVDHFKALNDSRGHQVGDDCLISIVGAIHAILRRPADFVARYGGEEFVLVLPNTPSQGATLIAEGIHQAVADIAVRRDPETTEYVTVSTGVATFDPGKDSFDLVELIRRADHAMYCAKANGRDRTCVFVAPEDAEDSSGSVVSLFGRV
jgi:diguanylate cyclase (GGDEF)-like protein